MAKKGLYGLYGGMYVPEILHSVLQELIKEFSILKRDRSFWGEYIGFLSNYSVRPTPLTFAENLTKHFGKAKIYIKREDLNHSGAHKINNVIGQGLVAKRLKKNRVIAETGAGQHGVATSVMAAKMGLKAVIYMGMEDINRQYTNVFWMKHMGATVIPVNYGACTLKDSINAALRDWVANFRTTHYCLGTACGPYPYPEMVTYFQSIIGKETRKQILKMEGKLPSKIYACVGGGSNALGMFKEFIKNRNVELVGVEAGGVGLGLGKHASRIASRQGKIGISQGYKTLFLQNSDGQMADTHSVAAGLDYIGVSPILADLFERRRVRFEMVSDKDVLAAVRLVSKKEGIVPALESAHAFARLFKEIKSSVKDEIVVVNLSGRGDKDIFNFAEAFSDSDWKKFVKNRGAEYES